MEPLRVVHAVPFFFPATRFGGPVTQLAHVCPELARRGHKVRVVTTDNGVHAGVPRERWVDLDGYHVWYGRTGRINRMAPYFEPMLRAPLEDALADADVLHLHVAFSLINELGRQVSKKHGVPYVYAPRGCLAPERLQARRFSKILFFFLFERRVIQDAAALHAVSGREVEHLAMLGAQPDLIRTIANGVKTQMQGQSSWRQRLGIPINAAVVLFLGQLIRIKGLDLLIRTVAQIRPHVPRVHLLIAGPDGGDEAAARASVKFHGLQDVVHFIGHVEGQQKADAFGSADVFALTSYGEGLPNAVLEACDSGVPVVITEACNLPEVADYEAGFVCPPQIGPLATALGRLLSDHPMRHRMGVNARRMTADQFSFSSVVSGLERLYRDVADARAPVRHSRNVVCAAD